MNNSPVHGVLTYRVTEDIDFSDLSRVASNAQNIRINFDSGVLKRPLDLGSLAFSQRGEVSKNSRDQRSLPVVQQSLVIGRPELLLGIYEFLCQYSNHKTVVNFCAAVKQIFDWCDAVGHTNVFLDEQATSQVYRAYSDHLYQLILHGSYNPLTAHKLQRTFCRVTEIAFPSGHLHISSSAIAIKAPRRNNGAPSEAWVSSYIRCTLAIARGFARAVIDGRLFPWAISFESFEAVIFPSNGGVYTPYAGRKNNMYRVKERRIATLDEYLSSAWGPKMPVGAHLRHTWRKGVENLERANVNELSGYRLLYANLALKAYACLLIAITGCYPSELIQFDYEEALELEKSLVKKELSAVKLRAGGRKTKYALGREGGLVVLREFIELRRWMLRGRKFDRLFFRFQQREDDQIGDVLPLSSDFTNLFHSRISGSYLDPVVPHLGARLLRRHKSVVLKSLGVSPQVVADLLNHSLATNISDYSTASVEQQNKELRLFWRSIRKASDVVRERDTSQLKSISVGHCQSFDDPLILIPDAGILPDCKTQFGCLYCDKYVCHADVEDVHKLLSLLYVVQAVRRSSPDPKHSESTFQNLAIRIRYILQEVSMRSEECKMIVRSITERVNDLGELTFFWESRLQRYEQLGVVF